MDNDQKINNLNNWLCEFQEDLKKIISKYRFSNHALSSEDLISEINIALLQKFDDFSSECDKGIKDQPTFKKVAYRYARNYISWMAKGASHKDQKYLSNRVSGDANSPCSFGSETQTVFDSALALEGREDEFFVELSKSNKFQNIISWIFDYSDFLTPHQKNVLELSLSGKNIIEISKLLEVSHQAVQSLLAGVSEEIKAHICVTLNDENSDRTIIKNGLKSVKSLFGPNRLKPSITNRDGSAILKYLSKKPKKYSLRDLVDIFNGQYKITQISAFVNRNKYSNLLKKKNLKTN